MQFPYFIEDWLLLIAKTVDIEGTKLPLHPIGQTNNKIVDISLARYDINFIQRTTVNFSKNIGLTERQIPLAVKIITKYRKQFAKYNLDPTYLHNITPLRIETRNLDRTRTIVEDLELNQFQIRFPYDPHGVQFLHETKNVSSCGEIRWDRDEKVWRLARTEGNLKNILDFLNNQKTLNHRVFDEWKIDKTIQRYLNQVDMAQQLKELHIPTMTLEQDRVVVVNSNQWIDAALEKTNFYNTNDDVLTWATRAERFGLNISDKLRNYISNRYPTIVESIMPIDSYLKINAKDIETLISNVNVDKWIFLNFYPYDTAFNEVIDDLVDVETVGEKIFYVKVNDRDLKDFEQEISDLNCDDLIIVTDLHVHSPVSRVIADIERKCLRAIHIQPDVNSIIKENQT